MDDNLSREPAQWLITDHPNRDRRAKNDREERKERRRRHHRLLRCSAFLSAIVLPNEVGLLIHSISPPDAQERRRRRGGKKGGDRGGERQVPVAVVCRPPTGKKEGRKLHVGEEARRKVSCPRFLSPMLSLQKVPTPPRCHPECQSQRARQTTSRLICHFQQGG